MALNISKFLDQFYMEANERITRIHTNMAQLEHAPHSKAVLLSIQRDMHTIKGSARMVGLKEISEIAHILEDVFLMAGNGRIQVNEEVQQIIYRGIDGISELLQQAQNKTPFSDTTPLQEEMRKVLDGKVGSVEPKPESPGDTEEQPVKKKFKLDFNALKKKFQNKIPGVGQEKTKQVTKVAPPDSAPPPAAVNEDTPSESTITQKRLETVEAVSPVPPQPVPPVQLDKPKPLAPEPLKIPPPLSISRQPQLQEQTYLKIDNEQFETIVNQVTDLLSKRYFFNNVLQTCDGLTRLTRGLRKEWHTLRSMSSESLFSNNQEIEAVNNIDNIVDLFFKKIQDFERDYQINLSNFESVLRDVYDNLLDLKLTPLSTIFNIYPRFVRDYAYRSDKKIRIYIRGGDTQLDKTVIEKINEPLVHLIRNACDHGVEMPSNRMDNGKTPTGTIIIEANKKGTYVEIKVSDDGKGLDTEAILKKAIENGLVDAQGAEKLDERQVFELIFHPGFSTATAVSDTSGRGIGMDIVKRITHQFGGNIEIQSKAGEGTTFLLEFPISIFTNKVTYIKEEGVIYAIPSNLIRRIVKLAPGDIHEKTDYSVVVHDDDIYTVAKLNQVLTGETSGLGSQSIYMLLPTVTEKKNGLIVDEILYESEVIIKEPGKFLGKRKYVYGLVIGARGELHTVLDMHDIVESDEFSRKIKIITPVKTSPVGKPCILVVDDSLLVREMERNLLESAGYEVVTAINGLDGYNKALSRHFDLVLADIEMPEMDGFEMIEHIKRITEYADTPTIVLSTVEREEDKVRGINLGVNAWLQKQDFNDSGLLKVIKRFIG